ncbi:MAG: hypothetical protein AAGC55_16485 [Myxococcota bacterium]
MTAMRQRYLDQFRQGILAGKSSSKDDLFRLLYGLPPWQEIELARHMTARFLPIYRVHHPTVAWPEMLLGDVDRYFSEDGEGLPDEPQPERSGDTEFYYCLHGLSDAWSYVGRGDLGKVTTACCTVLIWAVGARAANVWYADDPEAAHAFQIGDRETWRGRTPHHNVASRAVTRREWLVAMDWLAERDIGSLPESEDSERETLLAWWKDRECTL